MLYKIILRKAVPQFIETANNLKLYQNSQA